MKKLLLIAFAVASLLACKKETTTTTPPQPDGKYNTGVLLMNEGNFGSGNGTVAWYNPSDGEVEKEIFIAKNGFPTGNVLFSAMADAARNRVYLVVNNSQKIQVAKLGDMESVGEITGLQSPRYMVQVGFDKAYVSDWTSNTVAVINLNDDSIASTIQVGSGPERIAVGGSLAVVCNSGGFGVDSTITVINTVSDNTIGIITIGDNPNSAVFDGNGALWVLCGGVNDFSNPANSTAGKLVQIDLATLSITKSFDFPTNTLHPTSLRRNSAGTLLYYLDNGYSGNVMEMNISAANLPSTPIISGSFYNMDVNPFTNEIYTTDALDYTQDGVMYRFAPNGSQLDSVRPGLIPSNFWFN